jgi:hypothetical protein
MNNALMRMSVEKFIHDRRLSLGEMGSVAVLLPLK